MEEKIPYIRQSFSYQQTEKDKKYITIKEVERIKEHYGKPKNYITPFAYFCHVNSNLIKDDMLFGEKSKFLSKLWKELSPTKKQEFSKKFIEHRKNYEELYSEYLNRLPSELVTLTENLTALRDTPYNLYLKDVRSKDQAANVKENWENLSRTKRVKWILKSFEIQESAATEDYKKLVTNDEMAIIYKTLDKPAAHQSAYSMFRAIYDKSVSEGKNPVKWNELSKQERNLHKKKFHENKKGFVEQFAQYLLRLPEVCRKSEIINTKSLTGAEKKEICLLMNKLSGNNVSFNDILGDDESVEEEEEEEEVVEKPPKKAKKDDKLNTSNSKDKFAKTKKRSLTHDVSEDESFSEKQNNSNKKKKVQVEELKEKKSKKDESDKKDKKTKKSKKDKSVEEEEIVIPVEESIEEEMNTSKKRKKSKKDVSIKEEESSAEEVKVDKKSKKSKKEDKILEPEVPPT